MDWDVFISHAWEDKEDIAGPLAEALRRKGMRVWYDEFTLRVGDRLLRSIDHGLANSRYGVVILSPNFFAKEWAQKELAGLTAREVPGEKVILPVWHNITADQVRKYSPTLADRVAVSSDRGLEYVVEELLCVIEPASAPVHLPVKIEPPTEGATRVSGMGQPGETVIIRDLSQPGEPTLSTGTIQPDGTFSIPLSPPLMDGHVIAAVTDTGAVSAKVVQASAPTATPTPMPETVRPTVMERSRPFEPEMILIPAGEFLMGSDPRIDIDAKDDERPQHTLYLPDYYLAKTPVTNAQHAAFVQATDYEQPEHWAAGELPRGKEDHPVVYVSWHDAMAYCNWLAEVTGKPYNLPSEAEWEKGARGSDGRFYPWGNQWDAARCNSKEGGKEDTTPVRAYPQGASPYGLLDMAGNVWEWTRSVYKGYLYNPEDGREDFGAGGRRVLRGGMFRGGLKSVRCACRLGHGPDDLYGYFGVRVVVSPGSPLDSGTSGDLGAAPSELNPREARSPVAAAGFSDTKNGMKLSSSTLALQG